MADPRARTLAVDALARAFEDAAEWDKRLGLLDVRVETRSSDDERVRVLREAADLERQALVMKTELGDRAATAFVLEVLAWVAAAERRHERAATLLGAADALWRHLGLDPDSVPYLSENRRRSEEHAGINRGAAAFRAAFRRGAELSDEQTLALALEQAAVEDAPEEEEVPLTRRELEVAHLVGAGLSNREIADRLVLAEKTVKNHITGLLAKLGVSHRTQAALMASQLLEDGVVPRPAPPGDNARPAKGPGPNGGPVPPHPRGQSPSHAPGRSR